MVSRLLCVLFAPACICAITLGLAIGEALA